MQKDYRKCVGKSKKIHGAEERTAQDVFTGVYFLLKAHYQNDTTVVCFKQICRSPCSSSTPASHCRHGD